MKDPEFRRAYEELEPVYILIGKLIEQRIKYGLTQKQLASKLGTKQSAISRFESGHYNPSLQFLYKLARGLGVKLKIMVS